MKVLILGATGSIGTAVAAEMAAHGHQVRALARSDASAGALSGLGHQILLGDLRDPDAWANAVNEVDASGLESLEAINHRLGDGGIGLNLSEVKGPVMDRLKRTHFVDELNGKVFLTQERAFAEVSLDNGEPPEPVDHYMARGLI